MQRILTFLWKYQGAYLLFTWTLIIIIALLSLASAEIAHVIIPDVPHNTWTVISDPGGDPSEYANRTDYFILHDTKVILNGPCGSACTLYTAMLNPELAQGHHPEKNICAGPKGSLGFHAARKNLGTAEKPFPGEVDKDYIAISMSLYPENIRQWITKQGGLTDKLIWLYPPEIYDYIPACK